MVRYRSLLIILFTQITSVHVSGHELINDISLHIRIYYVVSMIQRGKSENSKSFVTEVATISDVM